MGIREERTRIKKATIENRFFMDITINNLARSYRAYTIGLFHSNTMGKVAIFIFKKTFHSFSRMHLK